MRPKRMLLLIPVAALVVGPATSATGEDTKTPLKTAQGPAATSAASGIPECDKYFTMVEACIATKKMSPEDQKATQFTVDRLRTMAPIARAPEGRAELMKRCVASLQAEQKDDKYGCYRSKG